jgi:transposase
VRGRPPGAIVRAWCLKRIQGGRPVGKGSGVSRSDRRRNARRERLRDLVPRDGVVLGIDLGDQKQALALVDHDMRVLWRRSPRCAAHQLGAVIADAAAAAASAGFSRVTVACEPTGSRWMQVQRLCRELGVGLVCIQPLVSHIAREQEDYTGHKTPSTPKNAVNTDAADQTTSSSCN